MENKQQLPIAIEKFMREYLRQRNSMLFWRSVLTVLVIVLTWVVLWCLADRVLHLAGWVRGLLLAFTLGALCVWFVQVLRETLLAKIDPANAAMELEHLRPDLDERLATVCSRMSDRELSNSSPALLEAISHQVEQCISESGVPRMVSLHSLGRHAVGAGAMIVTVLILWFLPIVGFPSLLYRFAAPLTKNPPVTTTMLWMGFDPAALDLREGQSRIINVRAIYPGDEGVVMHYCSDGKTWDARPMDCFAPGEYQAVAGPVFHDERFYLTSGDFRSDVISVRALRRPAVTEFRIRYQYPAYLKREPFIARNIDGLIEAPVGTTASIQIVATEPLATGELKARDFSLPLKSTIERTVMEGSFKVDKDQPYMVAITSAKGIDGSGPDGSQIRAIPDRAPFVQLVVPADDVRLSPRDMTPIRYQAMDDYGLERVAITVRVNNSQPIELPVPASTDARTRNGEQELDLATLGLKVGDVVAVNVVAVDGTGQTSTSPTRHLFAAPHSVNTSDYIRLSELRRSQEIAKEIQGEIKSAIEAMDRGRQLKAKPTEFELADTAYQQRIADIGSSSEEMRNSLSRAMARSTDTKTNDLLATFADRAEVRMIEAHDLIDELGKGDARELNARQRLERAAEQMRPIEAQLKDLADSALAAASMADLTNLKAAESSRAVATKTPQAAEIIARMRQDLADQMKQLGLNPNDPNAMAQLQAKATAGEKTMAQSAPLDLDAPAQAWAEQLLDEKVHAPMFDPAACGGCRHRIDPWRRQPPARQ